MTITCPRCGLGFESRATTATRCRRCRTVVRVGARRVSPSGRGGEATPDQQAQELAGGGVLLLVAGVVILGFYVVPAVVRAVRRRRDPPAPETDDRVSDTSDSRQGDNSFHHNAE